MPKDNYNNTCIIIARLSEPCDSVSMFAVICGFYKKEAL